MNGTKLLAGALAGCLAVVMAYSANADGQNSKAALVARFNRMWERSVQAERSGAIKMRSFPVTVRGPDGTTRDADVPLVIKDESANPERELMVAVWGELADGPNMGKFVNLKKYRWSPSERFFLCMKPASPVQFTLYQKLSDGTSIKVMPRDHDPTDLMTVRPSQPSYRFAIRFRMDSDTLDEIMSLVVVKAGSLDGGQNADGGGQGSGPSDGREYVFRSVHRMLERAYRDAQSTDPQIRKRFKTDTTADADGDVMSSNYEDVQILCSGPSGSLEATMLLTKLK